VFPTKIWAVLYTAKNTDTLHTFIQTVANYSGENKTKTEK